MSFMMLTAPCFACHRVFTSNPYRVPSYQNRPICKDCIMLVNDRRKADGLPLWPVSDDAYEPVEAP